MTKFKLSASLVTLVTVGALMATSGCSANKTTGSSPRGQGNSTGNPGGSNLNLGGSDGIGSSLNIAGNGSADSDSDGGLPATCEEAGGVHSYVGCDFWPTIVANPVWEVFDPAVVVANGGMVAADVVIDGPNAFHQEVMVAPGGLQTVLLKWVADLKGPQFSTVNTSTGRMKNPAAARPRSTHRSFCPRPP